MLKRIRHVLIEEISIRERLKVSVLGGRIWISFHFIRIKIYPVGDTAGMSEPNTLLLNFYLNVLSIKIGMSEPNNQSAFARRTRSSVDNINSIFYMVQSDHHAYCSVQFAVPSWIIIRPPPASTNFQ